MTKGRRVLIAAAALALLLALPMVALGEETTLLNQRGLTVAYIDKSEDATIYLWGGIPTAYLNGTSIYGFNGRHLGWFEDGIVRGDGGKRIGYTEETLAAYGKTPLHLAEKGPKGPKPVPLPEEPAPPKPVYLDSPSPLPLGELLRRGRSQL
jgi:hypothetical protein